MQSRLNPAFGNVLARVSVVPVLTVESAENAVALARALAVGRLVILEITLRTKAAVEAIGSIARAVPEAVVGAGTILSPEQADEAICAGARFLVSPGMTPRLLEAAERWQVPYLPGVATASEAMALGDLGYRVLKFFPAEPAGGIAALKALAAPLPHLRFCPTGGIDVAKARAYLALPNVVCVGGSWVAPAGKVAAGDWTEIIRLAGEAAALKA
jgi:2-dehydro-3-deoxyphosphogluconate aldolase/(4S)-4-hydroxy-2-oxoglutarate aldolase